MRKIGLWWTFLIVFALLIAGIFSLGPWTRSTFALPQVSQSSRDAFPISSAPRHLSGQPKHWRALVMQQ